MIRRIATLAAVLLTALVLQTSLFSWLTIVGFRPDLLLIVVVVVAFHDGPLAGIRVGAAAGLVTDLMMTDGALGISLLVYGAIGYAVGIARPYVAASTPFVDVALASSTGILATAAYGVLTVLLGDVVADPLGLAATALAVGVYNALLLPPLRAGLDRVLEGVPLNVAEYAS